ncbi:MAG: hypothetical protein UR27_C0014G0013 [Candidatus Peregrinibacteria bacterium GW2011_GWA2_33_10]|nr:MAG: hypothetical protein UR27_C0014G0013 [Candidatus Peregrinibacteria bacterium GW2011_GWA2_33_10]
MAENKIQFTDTDDLTPESEKLLQEEAEKAYLRSQNDEHFIEEISEILENEEKENFFPEALKTKLFENMGIDENDLESQQAIKTEFLGNFCDIIHKNLSAPEQAKISHLTDTPSLNDLKIFISNFKAHVKDEELKSSLNYILDNLLSEIEIEPDKFVPVTADIDKYTLLLGKIEEQLNKLSGHQREEYSKKIEILKKDFETLKTSEKTETLDTTSIKNTLENIKNNNKTYFAEISSISSQMLKPPVKDRKPFFGNIQEMKNELIAPQSRLQKTEEELKNIEEVFKDKSGALPPVFKKVQTEISESLQKIENILSLDITKFTPLDDTQRADLMTEFNKLFQNTANENIQTIIAKNTENLTKIIPASKTLFKSLDKFKIFQNLVNKTHEIENKLFGAKATIGDIDSYDISKTVKKQLNEKKRIDQISLNLNSQLEKFDEESKNNELFTDTELHEHFYRKHLFDKAHTNPEFLNDLEKAQKEFSALADMNNFSYDKEILKKEASIADKLSFFQKLTETLGKENINPSLINLYEKILKSEHNPETNLKKLMDKVNELEKTKKELLDAKNTDVLSDKIPSLMQNLQNQVNDLRKLEYEVFGTKKAVDVKKEINRKRRDINGQIEIDTNGNIISQKGKKLDTYLENLKKEVTKTKDELSILKDNVDKATDDETKEKNQNEYKIKYQYLIRLEEILEKKEADMQNFIISGHPEKIGFKSGVIKESIKGREAERFSNYSVWDKLRLSRLSLAVNPKKYWNMRFEAHHREALSKNLNREISEMLETGFAPEYKYWNEINKIIKAPYKRLIELYFKGHREGALNCMNKLEALNKNAVEIDQRKIEKLKTKYPELAEEEDIWNSKDIRRAITLHRRMLKATKKGSSNKVDQFRNELKSLIRDKEAANKEMQKLISLNLKGGSIDEAIKNIREKEKSTSEKIDKRTENIYQKFEKVLTEIDPKYYPNPKERFAADKEKWQKLSLSIRIPEDFDKNTIKPFFKFLKHHQKNSVYQFRPEDIIILLQMQNANLLNNRNQLSSALDFNKDYLYLKNQNKIKTVRDYLAYRKDPTHQQAMKI